MNLFTTSNISLTDSVGVIGFPSQFTAAFLSFSLNAIALASSSLVAGSISVPNLAAEKQKSLTRCGVSVDQSGTDSQEHKAFFTKLASVFGVDHVNCGLGRRVWNVQRIVGCKVKLDIGHPAAKGNHFLGFTVLQKRYKCIDGVDYTNDVDFKLQSRVSGK